MARILTDRAPRARPFRRSERRARARHASGDHRCDRQRRLGSRGRSSRRSGDRRDRRHRPAAPARRLPADALRPGGRLQRRSRERVRGCGRRRPPGLGDPALAAAPAALADERARDAARPRAASAAGVRRRRRGVVDRGLRARARRTGASTRAGRSRASPTSTYSTHKATLERQIARHAARHPELTHHRPAPGADLPADVRERAAAALRRAVRARARSCVRGRLPLLPDIAGLRFQAVHTDDIAEAYRLALLAPDARGAYNVAAEPVLDMPAIARERKARTVRVPRAVARGAFAAAYAARLHPSEPSWLDLALETPLMACERIAGARLDAAALGARMRSPRCSTASPPAPGETHRRWSPCRVSPVGSRSCAAARELHAGRARAARLTRLRSPRATVPDAARARRRARRDRLGQPRPRAGWRRRARDRPLHRRVARGRGRRGAHRRDRARARERDRRRARQRRRALAAAQRAHRHGRARRLRAPARAARRGRSPVRARELRHEGRDGRGAVGVRARRRGSSWPAT